MDRGSWHCTGVIKTILKKKKCQKAKWLSEEALQISEKRREVKDKGEKERYTHVNAEFQRIEMRDKRAFLSDPCKEATWKKRTENHKELLILIRYKEPNRN